MEITRISQLCVIRWADRLISSQLVSSEGDFQMHFTFFSQIFRQLDANQMANFKADIIYYIYPVWIRYVGENTTNVALWWFPTTASQWKPL